METLQSTPSTLSSPSSASEPASPAPESPTGPFPPLPLSTSSLFPSIAFLPTIPPSPPTIDDIYDLITHIAIFRLLDRLPTVCQCYHLCTPSTRTNHSLGFTQLDESIPSLRRAYHNSYFTLTIPDHLLDLLDSRSDPREDGYYPYCTHIFIRKIKRTIRHLLTSSTGRHLKDFTTVLGPTEGQTSTVPTTLAKHPRFLSTNTAKLVTETDKKGEGRGIEYTYHPQFMLVYLRTVCHPDVWCAAPTLDGENTSADPPIGYRPDAIPTDFGNIISLMDRFIEILENGMTGRRRDRIYRAGFVGDMGSALTDRFELADLERDREGLERELVHQEEEYEEGDEDQGDWEEDLKKVPDFMLAFQVMVMRELVCAVGELWTGRPLVIPERFYDIVYDSDGDGDDEYDPLDDAASIFAASERGAGWGMGSLSLSTRIVDPHEVPPMRVRQVDGRRLVLLNTPTAHMLVVGIHYCVFLYLMYDVARSHLNR